MSPLCEELMRSEHTTTESNYMNTWQSIKTQREIELKYLIRRFEIQLRYGCQNSECLTINCLSYKTNPSNGGTHPHRRPSPLTARILAFHLASDSDPYSKLCSNRPYILPQQLNLHDTCFDAIRKHASQKVELVSDVVPYNKRTIISYWRSNLVMAPGANPDRKSIIQNLFHTGPVRSFLWRSLPTNDANILKTVLALDVDAAAGVVEVVRLGSSEGDGKKDAKASISSSNPALYTSQLKIHELSLLKLMYQNIDQVGVLDETSSTRSYVETTLWRALGTPEGLALSFRECFRTNVLETARFEDYLNAFHWKHCRHGTIILGHLSNAIDALFIPPQDWNSNHASESQGYVADDDAAHMLRVCWLALLSWVREPSSADYDQSIVHQEALQAIAEGCVFGDNYLRQSEDLDQSRKPMEVLIDLYDAFASEPARDLAIKVVRATAARIAFGEAGGMAKNSGDVARSTATRYNTMDLLARFIAMPQGQHSPLELVQLIRSWLITVINFNWTGKWTVSRWEAGGAAIAMLATFAGPASLFRKCHLYYIDSRLPAYSSEWFLNFVENYGKDVNVLHLVNFPQLFPDRRQVKNFRALNYARMCAAYKEGIYAESLAERLYPSPDPIRHAYLEKRLEKATSRYLVLNVRREHLLEDTLNQLWGRERRELMKPLKVRMGMEMGEAGVDQGGVSQEFFRLVFRNAFHPDAGMFAKTDDRSSCFWPHPDSLEPNSTYQLLGLLTALGVYNGLTLSLSLPSSWYVALIHGYLGQPDEGIFTYTRDNLRFIKDGWPTLHDSFIRLLDYEADKVEDDFSMDWTYTYEANGHRRHIDMWKSKDTKSADGRLLAVAVDETGSMAVTGQNREEYVSNYIRWMCKETVFDQLQHFSRGFKTVIDDAALSVLEPEMLQGVVEGDQDIEIGVFQQVVKYEGYSRHHELIDWFWEIVREYTPERHRALLNFVTAVDRAPVHGIEAIHFVIQRQGDDSELLPTSSTCFGKLLLPEYSSKEKLKKKLDVALDNCDGFGTA